MRILTKPTIYFISQQQISPSQLQQFLDDHGISWQSDTSVAAELLVETAGRLCYMSYAKPRPGGNKQYLSHILQAKHGSVLEHAVFSFLITGISRSLSHELVRHRHMSFSQLSQRYVDASDSAYVEPLCIAQHPHLHQCWLHAIQTAHAAYVELSQSLLATTPTPNTLSLKAARQAARSVLPNAAETKIVVTANARAWRHFLLLRGSQHADTEIRSLAISLYHQLASLAPNLFADISLSPQQTLQSPYENV